MRFKFEISSELCVGCGNCVVVCPVDALNYTDVAGGKGALSFNGNNLTRLVTKGNAIVVNESLCNACGSCAIACPTKAITIKIASFSERAEVITAKDIAISGEKERVYELIKREQGLTVPEIAKAMQISEKEALSYVFALKKENKIFEGEKRNGYFVYVAELKKEKKEGEVKKAEIKIDKAKAEELKRKLEKAIEQATSRKVKMLVERGKIEKALEAIGREES